ncbi:MAG: AbgT family transporter, partial [Bdellovibrionales bacterium]
MAKINFQNILKRIEKVGNALPHPAYLFLIFTIVVVLISALVSSLGIEAQHPITKETIKSFNLFSSEGLRSFLNDSVKNFSGFAPLGTVLVAMLGFGIAEKSGLLSTLLRLIVLKSPRKLLVPAILFAGILSHTAGDVGYVLLIPLAALAFHSAGLNPLAGLAICFAGVSGGFAANFLLSTADPLLSGISQEAARIIDPQYTVSPLSNWYFMSASSILIVVVGTFVANKITIPFLGEYKGATERKGLEGISDSEKKGLLWAGLTLL